MRQMKDQAIVCNIGHFDNEIQMVDLVCGRGASKRPTSNRRSTSSLSPTATAIYLLAEGRLVNLGCATGHPSIRHVATAFANQTLAQIDLHQNNRETLRRKVVYVLPKTLDEEVARLHLAKLGVKLTELTKDQADYIGVPIKGPYKPEHYRY